MTTRKPTLTVVKTQPTNGPKPPRRLGQHGLALWRRIHAEYHIDDVGSLETLFLICAATDRAERLREAIDEDGEAIRGRNGMRANILLRDELQTRGFICRTLRSLGLTLQEVKPAPGRPGRNNYWSGDNDE
jgi:hypothetical protein